MLPLLADIGLTRCAALSGTSDEPLCRESGSLRPPAQHATRRTLGLAAAAGRIVPS